MKRSLSLTLQFILIVTLAVIAIGANGAVDDGASTSCYQTRPFEPEKHKEVYTVGVLAIRGFDAAYKEFDKTFSDYLTVTAGKRFDPPIRFEMKPLNFLSLFSDTEAARVDFIYVNPSAFSCIESEYEAYSLASQISRRTVGGKTYHLNRFGGVILARADNDKVQTIHDLRGKIVAAASISGLGSGQMQFREMQEAGMSHMCDPKQLVFTSNQGKVVNGVLNGDFDVGFIRTDQLERTKGPDGKLVDTSLFKIIDPKPDLQIDGVPFPFQASTALYPEWNLAALHHVPSDVSRTVQEAMLALADHARLGTALQECQASHNATFCDSLEFPADFSTAARCDTSRQVAETALEAMRNGKYSAWTPTLSYMELRSMQDATGFIKRDEQSKAWRCVRSAEIYDAISCPSGHVLKSKEDVEASCRQEGLECATGFQCVCSPCQKLSPCIDAVDFLGSCVAYSTFLPALLVPISVVFLVAFLLVFAHKSSQLVKQAKQAAANERDLNEFIAHEVRNPLSAALSAVVFANSAIQGDKPITQEVRTSLQDDLGTIDTSLQFINDLLRSMLDVHRAVNKQMVLEDEPIGVLHDILEPVSSLVYTRDTNFSVILECPETLGVKADRLRLRQVILNLARNACKFVEEGFVRLRAEVIEGSLCIIVEDSGPGIPLEKRSQLFSRFQQSLDVMAQGTGVGLNLCKSLVDLMGGEIWLDETYRSGHKNFPGTRIVVNLNKPPEEVIAVEPILPEEKVAAVVADEETGGQLPAALVELPEKLSVLFVDDSYILRKQCTRALKQAVPGWEVREAASGEACLQLLETESFDLIFMDQYMTSVEQSLLGTETTRALRSRGVESIICGLSANDLEDAFTAAGSDAFMLKPFPCKPDELRKALVELVGRHQDSTLSRKTCTTEDDSEQF